MPSDDADLDRLLFRQDSVISRRQAMRFMSVSRLRHQVASGRWSLPHRGVYVGHNATLSAGQRTWVGAFAAGNGRAAPLAGTAALTSYGLHGHESNVVHVYVPPRLRPRSLPHYVIVHRSTLPRADLSRGFPPQMMPARSVIDAAGSESIAEHDFLILLPSNEQRGGEGPSLSRAGRGSQLARCIR